MECLNCKKPVIIKKKFSNLFVEPKIHICNTCLKKYPLSIKYEVFPTIMGKIFVITLLSEAAKIKNFEAYMGHLSPIYYWFINKKGIIIIFDEIEEKTIELLQNISLGDILLITHKKLKMKEENL